jgi:hypothetical protein
MFFALIFSGNANNEANAGRNANTNNSASNTNTNIGAHLMRRILYKNISPATWQKTRIMNDVLVAER